MTDVWKNIFKKYIADFHAIDKLQADNIIEDEDTYKPFSVLYLYSD